MNAPASRVAFVDFLRGLAIVLMVLVHTARGVLGQMYRVSEPGPDFGLVERLAVSVQSFLFTIEPYISSLFLSLVGFSMVLVSKGLRPDQVARWRLRRLRTAAMLALLSWGIFWIHGGIQWPYPFLSAEILYTIAIGIVACVGLLPGADAPQKLPNSLLAARRLRIVGLALCFAAACALTGIAEHSPGSGLALLAQGPGAHLPNLAFVFLGALLGSAHMSGSKLLRVGLPLLGVAVLVLYHAAIVPRLQDERRTAGLSSGVLQSAFNTPTGRTSVARKFVTGGGYGSVYDLQRVAAAAGVIEEAPRPKTVTRYFWNKKLVLVPYLAGLMLISFGLSWWRIWARAPAFPSRLGRPVLMMGRHALLLYVLHLALVALAVVVFGRSSLSPAAAAATAVAILCACVLACLRPKAHRRLTS